MIEEQNQTMKDELLTVLVHLLCFQSQVKVYLNCSLILKS